jgi:hypothetical protein
VIQVEDSGGKTWTIDREVSSVFFKTDGLKIITAKY